MKFHLDIMKKEDAISVVLVAKGEIDIEKVSYVLKFNNQTIKAEENSNGESILFTDLDAGKYQVEAEVFFRTHQPVEVVSEEVIL